MAISNNSTGLRPGVCTSTTRPTAPYEGQHIYETDTDIEYVWNGSAWVVNYVSAASPAFTGTPTAPTATAGTNTTQLATTAFANTAGGLVYISSGTFTNVATADITGFSSTYDTYKLDLSYNTAGTVTALLAQLYSGATVRNTSYYGGMWYVNYLGASGVFSTRANAANFYLGDGNSTANPPNLVEATIHGIGNLQFAITGTLMDMANTASVAFGFTNYSNPSSFDKIRLTGNSANITGAWTLMGVRK